MAFEPGTQVRVNEGLLEGQTGTVTESNDHLTLVKIDDTAFGGGDLAFYTATLVSADEDHEALKTVKLYPDLLKGGYVWRLSTYVGGVRYVSLPMNSDMLLGVLKTPPAGLEQVECRLSRAHTPAGISWKQVWSD